MGGSGADWNHLRRAVSKLVTDLTGSVHHAERRAIVDAIPIRPEKAREPDIPVELFWRIVAAAPEHVQAAYVFLAVCSEDTGPYLRMTRDHLDAETYTVHLPGTKNEKRDAPVRVDAELWPWIEAAVPPPVGYTWLRKYWKRSLAAVGADTGLRLKDLRHCAAQWATDQGVPPSVVQTHMRHASTAMTLRYARQRDRGVVAHAVGDALLGRRTA